MLKNWQFVMILSITDLPTLQTSRHKKKHSRIQSELCSYCDKNSDQKSNCYHCTGNSLSEAFILASINPNYDNRFFIELGVHYKKVQYMLCT